MRRSEQNPVPGPYSIAAWTLPLLVVAFMVWLGYPLLVLGLIVPILVPFVVADLLTKPPPRARN
jgi:hypothetical protein